MSTGTSSGSPPSKLPDPSTATDLVAALEAWEPSELLAAPGAIAALTKSFIELDDTVRALERATHRTVRLRDRIGKLLERAMITPASE